MPKVSVIIPIYGVEKYLREAIDSVLNQTLKDLEIILIDDGGKDGCSQIIDEYAQKDDRIITIHKPNGGYGQSCNVGLERATGDYIAIFEPDDYIDKNMYEHLYKIAVENNSDIVKSKFYNNIQTNDYNECFIEKWDDSDIPQNTFKLTECPVILSYHPSIWSCIYKREFIIQNNIRFKEIPGAGWTDNPFFFQTMCLAQRINYLSKAYYYWRRLNESASDDLKDYNLPFDRCKEIHNWLEENNITDEKILLNLYKKEFDYIDVVLGMKKISDFKDCIEKIKIMINRMDENILLKCFFNNKKLLKKYYSLKKNPVNLYKKIQFKRFRQSLIVFKLKKGKKRISILGKTIWKS